MLNDVQAKNLQIMSPGRRASWAGTTCLQDLGSVALFSLFNLSELDYSCMPLDQILQRNYCYLIAQSIQTTAPIYNVLQGELLKRRGWCPPPRQSIRETIRLGKNISSKPLLAHVLF